MWILLIISWISLSIGVLLMFYKKEEKDTSSLRVIKDKNEKVFPNTIFSITKKKYNRARVILLLILSMVGVLTLNHMIIIIAFTIYIGTYPKERLNSILLPFGYIKKIAEKRSQKTIDEELMQVLSLMKNMLIQLREKPKGADYIIDFLLINTDISRAAFIKFLNLMRLGKENEAKESFERELKTPLASSIAMLLLEIDNIEPINLEQNILSLQNEIREVSNTGKQGKDEVLSDLILIPVIITMMLEFLNFLVVSYIGELSNLSYFFKV